jgi:phospholipid-translocating ATPase
MAKAKGNQDDVEVSSPVKRIRWATHRAAGQKGDRKRESLLARLHRRSGSNPEKKRSSQGSEVANEENKAGSDTASEQEPQRRIFFSMPLPDDARDDEGHPLVHFSRNKVRTAKYTPVNFIPKNLWLQFHNVANLYFFFIVILGVCAPFFPGSAHNGSVANFPASFRFSLFSAPLTQGSMPYP